MNGNEQYVFKTCTVQMKIAFKMKVEDNHFMHNCYCRGVVVIAAAQLHPTKPELRFCAGSSPACGVSEIPNGEDLCLAMVFPAGNKAKSLLLVNHTTETIHHHH